LNVAVSIPEAGLAVTKGQETKETKAERTGTV